MSESYLDRYYVYALGSGRTAIPHVTRQEAETEAARLVGKHPEKHYLVLHSITEVYSASPPVTVNRIHNVGL